MYNLEKQSTPSNTLTINFKAQTQTSENLTTTHLSHDLFMQIYFS